MRAAAFAITAGVHVAAAAVAAITLGWLQAGAPDHAAPATLVTFDVHSPAPIREKPNSQAARSRRIPASTRPHVATPLPMRTAVVRGTNTPEPPATAAAGGLSDNLPDVALSYRRALIARLESQRRYPPGSLQHHAQGKGSLLFRIDREGDLLDAVIVSGTGHAALDQAALAIVSRAAPFPPIPTGLPDELAVTLPIVFLIDDGAALADTP
ncbi:TonB family protein [Novosphingobium sp. BL-8H]|uniref:energy transducer TonB n=1 Tax=Novosphingobium sp. BL-8H TaxID=3127640 RepID=UPI003756540E